MIKIRQPKAIILDIEGTTTSTNYYPSAVAPYIRGNTENYLKNHWNDEHVQSIISDLRQHAQSDPDVPKILEPKSGASLAEVQRSALKHIEYLYQRDITTMALLYFQMYIWLDGQLHGLLKTHVFRDAAEMVYKWKTDDKIAIYLYSSARADVQMLMFACTEYGSLLHLIDGHFDSKIGLKTATDTYHRISQAIRSPPQQTLFLTDGLEEAKGAKAAGFKVILVSRERKLFPPNHGFDIITSFEKLKFLK